MIACPASRLLSTAASVIEALTNPHEDNNMPRRTTTSRTYAEIIEAKQAAMAKAVVVTTLREGIPTCR